MALTNSQSVVEKLIEFRRSHYQQSQGEWIAYNPFVFLLGAALNRGMQWRMAWQIPYDLKISLGDLEPEFLATIPPKDLENILLGLPHRPRYLRDAVKTIKSAARLVYEEFGGDAARVWQDASPSEISQTLRSIYGVGPGITAMTLRILYDEMGLFRGHESEIDVKEDVHVQRVFKRTGLIRSGLAGEAVAAARKLNPAFPGQMDWPAWEIGKVWCHPQRPDCPSCPLTAVCPRRW